MFGQWLSEITDHNGNVVGSLRLDLEDRGQNFSGNAYFFYIDPSLPGLMYEIRLRKALKPRAQLRAIYLYPHGGIMTSDERNAHEARLIANGNELPPAIVDVEFSLAGGNLMINWQSGDHRTGTFILKKAQTDRKSNVKSRIDLKNWDQFREWAISQNPRNFIFRGQSQPHKIVSSFYRTWRKDIRKWINEDVGALFGSVAEHLSYPLQIGNNQHNTAIWSILQHHGYPTPMIDWSFSPFVAAYFAFEKVDIKSKERPRIFIFDQLRWNERYGKAGLIVDAAPNQLVVMESMPAANPRHIPQKALSTVTNLIVSQRVV